MHYVGYILQCIGCANGRLVGWGAGLIPKVSPDQGTYQAGFDGVVLM